MGPIIILVGLVAFFFFFQLIMFASRYKKCPPDRVMVIYGKLPDGSASKCIHGGAAFIWPLMQDYGFLPLRPINMELAPEKVYCKGNEYVAFKIKTIIGISTEPDYVTHAADHLFGQHPNAIQDLATDLFTNTLKNFSATVEKDIILNDLASFRDKFQAKSEEELKKLGLTIKSLAFDSVE